MSTETISHENSTRIDHLSRLPNELLEDIFDHAYCTSPPPPMPISKRLLPFHQKHLFRRVSLSSPSSVASFISSLSGSKEKGKIVRSLDLERKKGRSMESIGVLEKLFPLLPNLQHLDLQSHVFKVDRRCTQIFRLLQSVKSVSLKAAKNADGFVDPDYFSFLSALPSLDTLKVLNWPILDYGYDVEENPRLVRVKNLAVEGQGAEDGSVVGLVKMCPALLRLELSTTYFDDVSFSYCLPALPSTLESLTLATTRSSFIHPVDLPLLRFSNLRSLELEDECYSSTIHSTLQQLPLLEKIRLGGGAISPVGFLTLLYGPARLVHLELLVLDFYVGERGVRVDNEPGMWRGRGMEDWKKPRLLTKDVDVDDSDDEPLRVNQLRHLAKVVEDNRVAIVGTFQEALENLEDCWVEKSNRAILSTSNQKDNGLLWLREVRSDAGEAEVTLPPLDIESLDPERLELVKTELPERDWSVYSLKNATEP